MECQLSVIPVCCRVLIKVTSAPLCSCKSIHAVNRSWQKQAQHIINDNSPTQWQEHIWQLLLMAVIFMWCQAVMFKVGFICQDCLTQMLILQGWLVSTSSPSHMFPLKLSQPSADRGSGITVVSFYCCCLSKGAYIESNFPLKGANCSQKIVTAIAWRWLAASFGVGSQEWKDFICGIGEEEKKKGAAHIKMCCEKWVWIFTHSGWWKRLLFFCQVEGKQKSVCILFLCKEVEAMCCGDGRCSYHKLLREPIRKTVHFPSCFVAL